MTSAQIDTIIANLTTTYTALSAKLTTDMSANGRAATFQQLATIRKELEEWESRKQAATDADAGGAPGVAVIQFVTPA
jgi:hypothetical protein